MSQLSILGRCQSFKKWSHFQFNPDSAVHKHTTWNSRNSIRTEICLWSFARLLSNYKTFIALLFHKLAKFRQPINSPISCFREQFNTWLSQHEANFRSQTSNGVSLPVAKWIMDWCSTKTKDDCVTSSAPPFIFRRLNDFFPIEYFLKNALNDRVDDSVALRLCIQLPPISDDLWVETRIPSRRDRKKIKHKNQIQKQTTSF